MIACFGFFVCASMFIGHSSRLMVWQPGEAVYQFED